jgi:hypothetical protein
VLAQAPPLPAYLTLPAQVQMKPNSVQEDYGEAEFNISGKPDAIQRGKHWNAFLTLPASPAVPTRRRSGRRSSRPWCGRMDRYLRLPGQEKVARYQKDGHDSWFGLWIFSAEDLRLDLVEVGPPTLKMKLNAPAAKPEVVSVGTGDFPYLSPLPGSIAGSGITTMRP